VRYLPWTQRACQLLSYVSLSAFIKDLRLSS
jgi:hypothetical protein